MPRVLVAASEVTVCETYRRIFSNLGYEVEIVASGVDCVAELRQSPTDMLLLDLGIPWGGGDGVLATMRDDCALRQVPVFLIPLAGHPQGIESLVPLVVAEALIASPKDCWDQRVLTHMFAATGIGKLHQLLSAPRSSLPDPC
jgi:CheY-like chemotaxis protein